jgi:hypothetical protein
MGEKSSGKRLGIGRLLLITVHSALVTALIPLAGFTADRELELQPLAKPQILTLPRRSKS